MKIKAMQKEKDELEEKCDIEFVMVDAMDQLVKELNENHVESITKMSRNIKKM